ncbi:MAG: NAD-dependent isocitrate dehydrogenase [Candidatus Marinimicrobia bacterium]|nr:NAD-dependent isocitrate dehydrogenase [Candidatus Neomarinimicrobiota bacterium]
MAQNRTVVLIPGDGIGPEIVKSVQSIFSEVAAPIDWEEHHAGVAALDIDKEVLPDSTIDAIKEHKIALKGPCTTPIGKGFSSVNVQLRKALDAYAAVRPIRSLPGVETPFKDVDMVIIRENTEGLYSGLENEIVSGVVTSLKVASEKACRRVSEWAFDYAKVRDRKKVTVFHKANIMKISDGLFLNESRKVHDKYPNIEYDEVIIDAGCMRMVQNPQQFDMLLLENLYGDIVSDLGAGLVGGLGVIPGANIGDDYAVFEAVHGSAPDIAGKGVANPLGLLMSAVMMLNHLSRREDNPEYREVANRIKHAYNSALSDGKKTRDIGGDLNTEEFTNAIIERIE